jgi:hypothetical protein
MPPLPNLTRNDCVKPNKTDKHGNENESKHDNIISRRFVLKPENKVVCRTYEFMLFQRIFSLIRKTVCLHKLTMSVTQTKPLIGDAASSSGITSAGMYS